MAVKTFNTDKYEPVSPPHYPHYTGMRFRYTHGNHAFSLKLFKTTAEA